MDLDFDAIYRTERRTGKIAVSFTSLAIIIACLGLFGLAAYAAEQRTKEIGIRKVLGANISTIVGMLSMDFIKLVLISILLAAPLAWWLLNRFLERYQYRIQIPWWVFPVTGAIALGFALAIVSTQALRAARANPVNSLRNE